MAGASKASGGLSRALERRLKLVARGAAGATFVVGALVLAGWLFELPRLTTVFAGNVTMRADTACGLVLAAVSLTLLTWENGKFGKVGKALAVFLLALGLVRSAEYFLRLAKALDLIPSDVSPIASFSFVGMGLVLLLLDARKRGAVVFSELAAVGVLLTSLLGLAGYMYGVSGFYSIAYYTSLPMHTAVGFLLLSVGALAARPERGLISLLLRDTSGSVLVRRLLPWALAVPFALGWLRVWAEKAGHFELAFGTALLTTLMITIFIALIWRTGVSLDRTDLARQRTAARLRENEAAKTAILDSALDSVIAIDREGGVIEWNPAAESTFGFSRSQAMGKPLADLIVPPRFREAHGRGMDRFRETGEGPMLGKRIEMPALRADGTEFPAEMSIAVSRADTLFFTAYLRDITERKQAEEALRESKARLEFTLEAAQIGDWDLDLIDDKSRRSLRHDRCFGYPEAVPEWGFATFLNHVHPEDRAEIDRRFHLAVAQQTGWHFECRVIWPDGSLHWIAGHGSIYRTPEGVARRMLGIVVDITERKRGEEELHRLKEELEIRVEQRTAELANANRELEAFGFTVSHDLRAPLRHIAGFIKLLEENADDHIDEAGRRYIRVISASANRMGNLIDDMLTLSRVGRATIAAKKVDLRALVDEARQELVPGTAGRKIEWEIGALPTVNVDPTLMRTVWINLLSNAIKYTRPRNPARIEVRSEETKDEIICSVRDNGVGFDMQFEDKLFGVFQRLHRADEFEGTGIGLASARRIIERHGGRTWAEGAVDHGATFYFSLPKHAENLEKDI